MRKLKFRSWNGESMEYGGFNVHATGSITYIHEMSRVKNNSPVMQFTGLKDKNGVDIYEGDIVIDHNGRGEVEYSEKYAGFRVNYKNSQCKWFYDYNLRGERESIEVIGDIYEDKNLADNN